MGEPLGLSYSQYCSLNTSHGTGKLFCNQNLFQLVITLSTLVKLIYEKTVIIYCLQGGVGWGGGLEDLGCVTIKIQLISP